MPGLFQRKLLSGRQFRRGCCLVLLALWYGLCAALDLPKTGLEPGELAIVVNENDPFSIRIAEYYRQARNIPRENIIRVRLSSRDVNLPRDAFQALKTEVDRQTGARIQAYAVAWTKPFRVDCMSITSALALGFDNAYCSKACGMTKASPYFGSMSVAPYGDLKIRPAMLLAGQTFDDVKRLIDRGVASDFTYPRGTGYLLTTADHNRSVRSVYFDEMTTRLGSAFHIEKLRAESIKDKRDVFFYFTGLKEVPNLNSLRFLPGAIADHLTSTGGVLVGSHQMSSLRWLEAGATGSYGTVIEPCNHLQKFPNPVIALWRYAEGNTLIESYWKSVAWPGEGVFIGEPLARPFAPKLLTEKNGKQVLSVFSPENKMVRLEASPSPIGPHRPVQIFSIEPGMNRVTLPALDPALFYRIAL